MRTSGAKQFALLASGPLLMVAIIATLHRLGSGVLAAPPLTSLSGVEAWASARDAPTIGLAGLRLLALVVAYHLVATTALALCGRLLRWPGVSRLAERATLPPFRSVVRQAAGLALSASTILASAALSAGTAVASPGPNTPTTATLRLVGEDPSSPAPQPEPATTATLRQVPPVQPDVPSVQPTGGPTQHLVHPGDHLWSIAEQQLAAGLGRQPSEPEITAYWLLVMAANPQLVHPDLLFSGEPVHLPPLPVGWRETPRDAAHAPDAPTASGACAGFARRE